LLKTKTSKSGGIRSLVSCLNVRTKRKKMRKINNNKKSSKRCVGSISTLGFVLSGLLSFLFAFQLSTYAADKNSPLTKPQQSAAKKGNSYAKSSKGDKAQVAYQTAIDQAISVEQCIALVKQTERYGSILIPVRRNCLNKALHIAKTQEEYFQIIACARQCQLYEITKEAVDMLIAKSNSKEELIELAHKAQSMAMNDIAHIAMQKLYTQEETSEDKIAFAKQAKLMAMEDLMRQAIKDAMDQETNAHVLCRLITAVEPLEQIDLERKILRRAVYQIKTVQECKEVYEMAKRLGQADIVELAGFKGRKMLLMQQAQNEQAQLNQQQDEEARKAAEQAAQDVKSPAAPSGPGF